MSATDNVVALFGREGETRRLRELIEQLGERGGAMLIAGEAGIGKSAVLAAAARFASARGALVLRTVGVQSEAQLPFAALHQLVAQLVPAVTRLPSQQRTALLTAFGMADGPAPELFLVALAALNLIGEAAGRSPVLLTIDDAHWLDQSSASALAFVARRLESEPVLLLAALRDGLDSVLDHAALPRLHLEPLDDAAAEALLDAHTPGLEDEVRQRVLNAAAGNPLALVELPQVSQDPWELAVLSSWLPLSTRLEQAFIARAADLNAATRTLLLVLAADDGDLVSEVLDATGLLRGEAVDLRDLAPAVTARLVEVDGHQLHFRHPLMRSAIYQSSTVSQRHAAHAALAETLVTDPDRRAWHLALSTVAPAETVASDVQAMAQRAQRRGGAAIAIAGLARAAALSEDPALRGQRLLRAAELGFELGRPDLVRRLVAEAEPLQLRALERSHLQWLRGVFDGQQAGGADRFDPMVDTALALIHRGEDQLALKILWSTAIQCWWTDPGAATSERIVEAAERLHVTERDPQMLAILAFASPLHHGATVLKRLARMRTDATQDAETGRIVGTAANAVGAFDMSTGLLAASAIGLRAQGRLGLLARCLTQQAWSAAHRVDLSVGLPAGEEAYRLTGETVQPTIRLTARAIQALLSALRGDHAAADAQATEAQQFAAARGARALLAMVQHARGVVALAAGQYDIAYEHLHQLHNPTDPSYHSFMRCFSAADLADAAAHSGQLQGVRPIIAGLEAIAVQSPSPLLHANLRYARALTADDADAPALFEAAHASDATWPFLRARSQLAHGAWLRRHRRAADSRALLRAARDAFDALGTIPWSERARQELRASGETSRRRAPEARDQLTAQELQIAQMAADGLTNPEIAQRLFISPRTVSSHLYRIFPKLGIAARSELSDAINLKSPIRREGETV